MDEERKEMTMEKSAFHEYYLLDSEIYNDSSYPISIPSQPPDIRNWFSSYESQQQSANSIKGAYFLCSHELNESEMQDRLEDSGKRKLQELCQSPEKEQPDLGQDTFARDDILNLSLEIFSRKSTGTDSVTTKKKRSLRQILRDEFLTNGQNSMIEQSIFPENENICVRREKHEEPKSYMLEVKTWKEELEKKCRQLSSNKSEQKKEDHVHHTEENLNKNTSEAGFISPKLRPNLHSNIEKESKNRGNCDKEGHDSGGFRRPLIDKTNHADKSGGGGFRDASVNKTDISVGGVPTEDLSSGKWHCPRKRKAYVGPHLKQLGLEQWIHRAS